jgi:predicted Zn-dependent protease
MKLAPFLKGTLAALLLSTASVSSHAAPSTGSLPPNYRPALDSVEGGLWQVLDQAEQDLRLSPLLVRDEALNDYVRKIACDLAGPQCPSLRVYVVNDATANAFCAANGMIVVFTGLLLRSQSEAELAFVLGHEISHYTNRHSVQNLERMTRTAGLVSVFSLGGLGVGTVAGLIAIGALASYSRDQEREADTGGFELSVAKGYDPRLGASFFVKMGEEEKANPRRPRPSPYASSHPATSERLETLNKRAAEIEAQTQANVAGVDTHRAATASYRAAWLEAELNRGQYADSLVVINQLIKAEPGSAELQYFLGEVYRRRNANGDLERASTAYQAALAAGSAPLAVHRGVGLVALKAGQKEVARDAFEKYLANVPEASDRAMIQFYLSSMGGAQ